jgi:hypothetical protein
MAKARKDNKPPAGKIHYGEVRMHAESSVGGAITGPARIVFVDDPHQRRWQGDPVEKVLEKLYPQGIPRRDLLSNADLVDAVRDDMRASGVRPPSLETILRAARRKPR